MTRLSKVLSIALPLILLVAVIPASAVNLLVNPSFETPPFVGAEVPGAGDAWTSFNGPFRIQGQPPIGPAGAFDGTVVLKTFAFMGVFQQFPASPGQIWNGGTWLLNDSADPMGGGQTAAVNIEWIDAGGGLISFISNGTFNLVTGSAPVDQWTQKTVTGAAPAGTAFARLVLITGDFNPGGFGGAPRFDDAFFEILDTVPTEDSTWGAIKSLFDK